MLGQTDLTKDVECEGCAPAQKFPIKPQDIIVHERYDKEKTVTQGHDIALVRLPRLANTHMEDEKYKVMPICLNYMKNQKLPSATTLVAGWGRDIIFQGGVGDHANGGAYSSDLLEVRVPVIPTDECKKTYSRTALQRIHPQRHICAGGESGIQFHLIEKLMKL